MKVLRWIAIGLGVLVLLALGVVMGARFADGPLALLPGGPFASGDWVEGPAVDWTFAKDIQEIELQSGDPERSRTVWILVLDGEAYVPCSLTFPPGKRWHTQALNDPEAVVRVEGKRYRRNLRKVEDEALHAKLVERVAAKYAGVGPPGDAGSVWFFRLAPSA